MKIIESNLNFNQLQNRKSTELIILHHAEHSTCSVVDIHKWHKYANGWSGIGYHFFITKDGQIYKGRPEMSIGAQCKGFNSNSIGICVQGNYMIETVPKVQLEALKILCEFLINKYSIKFIKLHRELNNTSCPGINFPTSLIKSILK